MHSQVALGSEPRLLAPAPLLQRLVELLPRIATGSPSHLDLVVAEDLGVDPEPLGECASLKYDREFRQVRDSSHLGACSAWLLHREGNAADLLGDQV
jgi:hypothetical protein